MEKMPANAESAEEAPRLSTFTRITRRLFLKGVFAGIAGLITFLAGIGSGRARKWLQEVCAGDLGERREEPRSSGTSEKQMSVSSSHIYVCRNGTPEQNMARVLEMMGGIGSVVGKEDIVILKPNAQWWNQGMTNTNAMKQFIEEVLEIPGFRGEVIIADNHHYSEDNSRGWTTELRNGDFNYNELVAYFNRRSFPNVTKYHWHDGGPNPHPRQGTAGGGRVVKGPWEGDGYVWCEDMVYVSQEARKCMMTYPVFTSSHSRITINLRRGAWKGGAYTERPTRFINFSALNHHSSYAGVTASIKNLMGVVDMTCGYHGLNPKGFFNTHFIGYENAIHRLGTDLEWSFSSRNMAALTRLTRGIVHSWGAFHFKSTGGALGYWMSKIRKPDLNIITAEVVGYGSRIDSKLTVRTKTILASTDPVALDYWAAKHVLLPATRAAGDKGRRFLKFNDPDQAPFRDFLVECHKQLGGNLNESAMILHQQDFAKIDRIS